MKSYIFILIISLSFILRFYQLGQNPASLDWDEASLGYNAYSILKTGKDEYGNFMPFSIRSFNDFKPPLYTYLSTIPVYLFGLNEFSVRLVSAVFGVIAVSAAYFLVKDLFIKEKIALLVAFLFAVSPWHIQFSRIAFEANLALTLILLGTLNFIRGLKGRQTMVISALFFGFSVYAYHSPRLIVPVLLTGLTAIYLKSISKIIAPLFLFAFIMILFYIPVIRDFKSSSGARFTSVSVINPNEKLGQSIAAMDYDNKRGDKLGTLFHNRRIIYAREILAGYLDHFNFNFLFLNGDPPGRHHASGMGMLYIIELPLIIIGFIYVIKNLHNNPHKIIFLQFLIAPLASSFTSGTPHAVRAIYYLPAYQVLAAFGLVNLLNLISLPRIKLRIASIAVLTVVFLYSINFFYYLHQYYKHTPVEYASEWQYGYKQAVAFSQSYENRVAKIIFTYEYDQPYVYFLFYNLIDPGWYQQNWGEGEINRNLRIFGKYEFRNIDWEKDQNLSGVLLVGSPKEIPPDARGKIAEINYPDGSVAFRIVLR